MPGWEAEKQLHSGCRSAKEDRSGYTDGQAERLAGYGRRLLELGTTVVTHPYGETLSGPDRGRPVPR
ncbi:hypothetical protein ACIGJO_29995 [Streptomyces sp. NPDC079020]|uniref:hypothetical protein n=1 Tax=Streptomyces sp. NPDC079020 TaxID=3365722 RepID=UPI0037D1673E